MQRHSVKATCLCHRTEDRSLRDFQSIDGEFSIPEEKYFYDGLIADLNKPQTLISGIVDAQGDLPKGTLFVIARSPAGGMPVAVQKVPIQRFQW